MENQIKLWALRAFTPGYFAAVKRANAFCSISSADDLADEVKLKNAASSNKNRVLRNIMPIYKWLIAFVMINNIFGIPKYSCIFWNSKYKI
nr:hypothetical protein [uncultured Campylobacter sp.]